MLREKQQEKDRMDLMLNNSCLCRSSKSGCGGTASSSGTLLGRNCAVVLKQLCCTSVLFLNHAAVTRDLSWQLSVNYIRAPFFLISRRKRGSQPFDLSRTTWLCIKCLLALDYRPRFCHHETPPSGSGWAITKQPPEHTGALIGANSLLQSAPRQVAP